MIENLADKFCWKDALDSHVRRFKITTKSRSGNFDPGTWKPAVTNGGKH